MRRNDSYRQKLGPYQPAPDSLLIGWTTRLSAGETSVEANAIARRIIENFCNCVWTGGQPERPALEWLAEVLSQILTDGKPDARKAFSLSPKQARGTQTFKHLLIVQWVRSAGQRGYEHTEAKNRAAEVFAMDLKSIQRILNRYSDAEIPIVPPDLEDEQFKLAHHPLPPFLKKKRTRKGTTSR